MEVVVLCCEPYLTDSGMHRETDKPFTVLHQVGTVRVVVYWATTTAGRNDKIIFSPTYWCVEPLRPAVGGQINSHRCVVVS